MSTAEQSSGSVPSVASFHTKLKPRPADAFLVLRALALSLGPDVTERVADGGVVYCRREQTFLQVTPAKSRLHIGFPAAVALDDPNGRLLKRGTDRFVAVDGPEGVDGHVQEFIRKSYTAAR